MPYRKKNYFFELQIYSLLAIKYFDSVFQPNFFELFSENIGIYLEKNTMNIIFITTVSIVHRSMWHVRVKRKHVFIQSFYVSEKTSWIQSPIHKEDLLIQSFPICLFMNMLLMLMSWQIAAEVAAPLGKTEEIVLLSDTGSGGGKLTNEITKLVGQLPPAVQALTGVDLSKVKMLQALLSRYSFNFTYHHEIV